MIIKEKIQTPARDWKQKAGDEAEREMAFYLRRYFADDPDVLVLHDVRLELDGDAAQMDHVLIHKAGLTVVESKSVAGKVQMRADGQWLRWYQDRSSGMASPLVQASLQCEFLRKYLRKFARQPEVIDALEIGYLVAISSRGIFLPPAEQVVAEVCKAELVGERIRTRLATAHERFPAQFRKVLADYMCRMHAPREMIAAAPEVAVVPSAEPAPRPQADDFAVALDAVPVRARASEAKPAPLSHLEYVGDRLKPAGLLAGLLGAGTARKVYATLCRKCSSQQLEFRYGKYGYYFKCLDCAENTNIKLDCRKCGRQVKLRKEEHVLFAECAPCKLSEVVHRNDSPILQLAD